MNPYLDINYRDRTQEIEDMFRHTLEEVKNDPKKYSQLINDLMFHWMFGICETKLMWEYRQSMNTKIDNQ
jgi:hypothetical protein